MNILILTPFYPIQNDSNPEKTTKAIHYFAREWVKLGHKVIVIHNYIQFPKIYDIGIKALGKEWKRKKHYREIVHTIQEGVSIYLIPVQRTIPHYNFLFNFQINKHKKKIINIIEKKDFVPDVIVSHFFVSQRQIIKSLATNFKCKYMTVLHSSDISYMKRRFTKTIFNDLLEYNDKIGFRSKKIKIDFEALCNANYDGFIAYSGAPDYILDIDTNLNESNKIHNKINIIYSGNLIPLKNVDITIKALSMIQDKYDFVFRIIGRGPLEESLKQLVSSLGMNNRVEFLGYMSREKVIKYTVESDYFIMVSSPETFGISYIEAMACRCVVIGSEGEGIDGVIINDYNGFLVEPNNVINLSKRLCAIFEMESSKKDNIIAKARETAKKYTESNVAKKYLSEILDITE